LVALGLAAAPASAVTISLTVNGGGLNGVQTRTCNSTACSPSIWSLASGELYATTGTISIDTTLSTMTVTLATAVSVIDQDPSILPAQPVSSDGATSLVFNGGTYVTAAIPISIAAGALPGTTVYSIAATQVGAVSFTSVVPTGAGTGDPLSLASVRVTGSCTLVNATNTGTCGVSFGPSGATNFRIPGTGNFGGYDRWVQHTHNVAVVPEPTTALLFGLGLGSVAILRRRNTRP
jgi:hypothetical protein